MVHSQESHRPDWWPSLFPVRIVVVIVVAVVTVLLTRNGYDPNTALVLIVLVTTTALDLAQRVTVLPTKPAHGQ
ncbi:hypothetical protein ADL01_12140 [Streptomyces sp. NRRL WC-3618]|uniref:hypothetical protein n=1 Tax=Streptomyces sp. NRRL WC-3618 TaxID=1519490 RepID=UPI0006AFF54E|nr:hypothetical protein [Streptomyces sp. NRRL WC-3618]KOV80451.1 hypothetical protein ADL01_12140 [Streptomyces sp. NRRL WC-3618]